MKINRQYVFSNEMSLKGQELIAEQKTAVNHLQIPQSFALMSQWFINDVAIMTKIKN